MRPEGALRALRASEFFRILIFRRWYTLYCLINFEEQWLVSRRTLVIVEECTPEEIIRVHIKVFLITEGGSIERIWRELSLKNWAKGTTQ